MGLPTFPAGVGPPFDTVSTGAASVSPYPSINLTYTRKDAWVSLGNAAPPEIK